MQHVRAHSASVVLDCVLCLADGLQPGEIASHLQTLPATQISAWDAVQLAQQEAVSSCQSLAEQCLQWQQAQSAFSAASRDAADTEQVAAHVLLLASACSPATGVLLQLGGILGAQN